MRIRVIPRAGRDAVGGRRGEAVIVRVAAAPAEGAANEAVVALLARQLGVPRAEVRIEAGAWGRDKLVSLPSPAAARLRGLA